MPIGRLLHFVAFRAVAKSFTLCDGCGCFLVGRRCWHWRTGGHVRANCCICWETLP
jgi:hypothetical protein